MTSEREEQKPRSRKKQRTSIIHTTFEEKNERGMVALTGTLHWHFARLTCSSNARKSVIGFL